MSRLLWLTAGVALLALAGATLGFKAWLGLTGPYVESLPPHGFCSEAATELEAGRTLYAIELAEAGGCEAELRAARSEWDRLGAVFQRCLNGVWTGRAEDGAGLACAIVSDLVVFGDVRDLTRQGLAFLRGEETDDVLVALSAAGVALTFAPQAGAGNDLLKAARRAGALSEDLARGVVKLAGDRAWRPLAALLGDAGRMAVRLGPARATRALRYADDADELATVARFVETAPSPLLGLEWGGKGAARLADGALYAEAVGRGPRAVELAVTRGARALLSRQPLVVALAKRVWAGDAVRLAELLLTRLTWAWAAALGAALGVAGALSLRRALRPLRRGRRPPEPTGRSGAPARA